MKINDFLKNELPIIAKDLNESNAKNLSKNQKFQYLLSAINLDELMRYAICENIFYFKSKYKDFSLLGLGCSQTIDANDLQLFLSKYPEYFLSASFTFEDDPHKGELTLHEWTFIKKENQTHLLILPKKAESSFSRTELLIDPLLPLCNNEKNNLNWNSYEELPESDQWKKMIDASNALFQDAILDKIVLSRKKIFTFPVPLDSLSFFYQLLQKNSTNAAYHIFKQKEFGDTFISITPERLFSIQDHFFETISLAASAPRGNSPEEDLALENHLRTDDKLSREHEIVTDEIMRRLSSLTKNIDSSSLEIMKLPYIQHRAVTITAKIDESTNIIDLIDLLHPTPAVGGIPRLLACAKITELEELNRNEYAAPIGIISSHFSELAVGIRSAFIKKEKITITGGAGIVKGSDAKTEWDETGTKMNPFLKVINHD